jgi:hypothetical protein
VDRLRSPNSSEFNCLTHEGEAAPGPADRVKLLRLLKSRTVHSLRSAAPLLGYSERQLQRW